MNERQISPLDVPADQVVPVYRALKRLFELLYSEDLRLTLDLKAGEGLLFDNQRLLHGRTGFTPETPPRAVLTSSVDLDDFHSSMRLLQRYLNPDAVQLKLCHNLRQPGILFLKAVQLRLPMPPNRRRQV